MTATGSADGTVAGPCPHHPDLPRQGQDSFWVYIEPAAEYPVMAVGPYPSLQAAFDACNDAPIVEGLMAEEVGAEEVYAVAAAPGPDIEVHLVDPRDPTHFGRPGIAGPV